MLKKGIVILITLCVLFSAGCASPFQRRKAVFSVDSYGLQITADSTFQEKTGGSYDLQITNNRSYISIMAYQYIDLPEDITPLDVFQVQNEDIFSKRTAVVALEEATTQGAITQSLYSAERDGVKNYYASYLIDFPKNEVCAWVLVSAAPSYFTENRDTLHKIVCSLSPIP